jgi:hypothetical protein
MFRKFSRLKLLEARKQLLLVESDLNRVELVRELEDLRVEIDHVKKNIRTVGSIASSAVLLASVISIFGGRHSGHSKSEEKTNNHRGKMAWVSSALSSARSGASLLMKIRSIIRNRER